MKEKQLFIVGVFLLAAPLVGFASGLWVPLSPEDLIEKSSTIFVGTVTAATQVDVEYQSKIARNGTIKESVGPETMTLEEYTVNVEEFLKNPQESETIKVLRATVGGVPSGPARISGFEIGERVLFYLPSDEKQTHFAGQYLPESFKIPKQCDAKSVLEQPRIDGRNSFEILQNETPKKDNFTAGIPMKFVISKDTGTLFGSSIDVNVGISNETNNKVLYEKNIHAESEPCQWITSAEWEFTPEKGDYRLYLHIRENGERGTTSYTGFSVISDTKIKSPLKQIKNGASPNDVKCNDDMVLIQKYDGTPACVTPDTKTKLVERGWALKEQESLILKEGQSWGYIKNISVLDENEVDVTTSYPTNEAHHMAYPDEYQSIIGDCNMKNNSAILSLLYLQEINPDQSHAKFGKEIKTFDGLQCDDAFWQEMTTRGYCGPPHQLIHRTETLVSSIEEAQSKTNFVLDVPSYLPEGYSIQKITVNTDGSEAMLYASDQPITSEMDGCEFTWDHEGIFLFYTVFAENFDFDTRYAKYLEDPKKEPITINENPGYSENRWVGDRFGMPIPQQSKVVLYMQDEEKIFEVHSSLAVDELIKIAQSTQGSKLDTQDYHPVDPADIVNANNQFAFDFYSKISQSKNNIFFSPTSISTAFSILFEGTKENTAEEIQSVFGFPENDLERKQGYLSLHNIINENNNENVRLHIANALWLAERFEPLAEYIDTATKYYDSSVNSVDFVSNDGVNKINDWVKSKTEEKIEKLLEPGSTGSNTRMAITNAIYFKGLWEHPFDPEDTYETDFVVSSEETVKVQMMTFPHKMRMNITSTETMKMLELPYKNNTAKMLILLPNEPYHLMSVEDSLTVENLATWKSMLRQRDLVIHLPKFSLDTEYNLKETLPDMGMPSAFNMVHADLSGISGYKGLYISQAIHKAFVDVNEEGTEAAGATAIVGDESGGQLFKADHPFIFIIQDNETNSILFIGKIVNPTL